jgi:LPS-assembly protein
MAVGFMASALPAAAADLIRLDSQGQTTIRADRITADDTAKTVLALGEVEIEREGRRLYADRVLLHTDTMLADASGRVRFTTAGEVMSGRRMLADMNTGTGKIYDARLLLTPTHFYLSGQEIERLGPDTYWARNASLTSCDGENPPWRFSSQEINVEVDGYGTARNATFDIKGQPVLWSPWFLFPAKTRRQSGLLLPNFAFSSRDGFTYSQSYFQTLGESQDLTLSANIMTERGVNWGLEYRYNLDGKSKGIFMLDFMPGDSQAEELWQSGANAGNYDTRWWLRGKADHYFDAKTSLRLDFDTISDRDYLQEFDFYNTGYWSSIRQLRTWFNRDIDSQYSLSRTNILNFNHRRESESFNAAMIYYDRLDTNKTTLQQLPYLTFDMARQSIGDTPLYFSMDAAYSYYYREEDSRGHTLDIAPQISMPLNFSDYLILEPSLRWRPRLYELSLDDQEKENMDAQGFSNDINFTVDASSYLYNVYDFSDDDSDLKIKHALRPRISYTYQSAMSGSETLPWLMRRNELNFNRVSYGLENSFTVKTAVPPPAEEEQTSPEGNASLPSLSAKDIAVLKTIIDHTPDAYSSTVGDAQYNEFMRLNLYHSYYLQDYADAWGESRSLGDIEARWELMPFLDNWLSFTVDAAWDIYNSDFDVLRALAMTRNQRGDFLGIDYNYTSSDIIGGARQTANQIRLFSGVNLVAGFSVDFETRYNLQSNERFEHLLALNYRDSCWGISLIFHEDDRAHAFYLAFNLAGIGGMGGR